MKEVTAHITFAQAYYADSNGIKTVTPVIHHYDPRDCMSDREVYAGSIEVEIPFDEPSPADFVLAEVVALRKKQGDLVMEGTKLEERIQSLLCIEAPKSEVIS
jgi:hypothetical protein